MKKFFILLIIAFLPLTYLFPRQERVAVIDFRANGVPVKEARIATERIRTVIKKNHSIVERNHVDWILKYETDDRSGCYSTDCLVSVGKLLSADKIVAGSFTKWNNSVIIAAKIIDVPAGVVYSGRLQRVQSVHQTDDEIVIFVQKLFQRKNRTTRSRDRLLFVDFLAKGVSKRIALFASEWFRTGIINNTKYIIIDRSHAYAVLKEQKFRNLECRSDKCLVSMGKLLSQNAILSGSITSKKGHIVVSAKIIDVSTSAVKYKHKQLVRTISGLDLGIIYFTRNFLRIMNGESPVLDNKGNN